MVSLQPGRAVRQQRISSRMRAIETVFGKLLHQVEDPRRQRRRDAALRGTLDENGALLGHFLRLFFAHRPPQQVGTAQRIASQYLGYLHHLLLVDDDPVGARQNRLERRVQVVDGRCRIGVFPGNEVVDHARLERTRTKQRNERHQIVEVIRFQTLYQVAHAAGFQLEDRAGAPRAQQLESRTIIERQRTNLERRGPFRTRRVYGLDRPVDDGQCAQPEEIELHQANSLEPVLIELGHCRGFALHAVQRREIDDARRRDHHAAGVLAGIAHEAFQLSREVDKCANIVITLVKGAQFRLTGYRVVQLDLRLGWDQLGDPVGEAVRLPQHPAHIPDDRPGRHGSKRDDLRHPIAPITLPDVVDDAIASLHAEVDVEIGHGDALGIEEALE